MLRVGLTGNVASGKSTVARMWREAGVPVVSADELAREAVAPGSEGLEEVRSAFGDEVLGPDGSLARDRLRRKVFTDEAARERLEAILHPRIRTLRDRWMQARRREGAPLVVAEIPLLFEAGVADEVDVVVLIDAPAPVRLERLMRDRGLDEAEARRIMDAQMDASEKRARADLIVDNDGTRGALEERAGRVLERLRRRAGSGGGGGSGDAGEGAGAIDPGASQGEKSSPGRLLRLDLHLHTWGSYDCLSDPERVLARAEERGVGRIALTDHDRLAVALRMAERHPERVIPGEEVRTDEGIDVIGLYLSEEIPRGTPAREVCDRIRAQGGVVYLPHPYARGKGGGGRWAEELAPLVDVVEVFNGRLHPAARNDPAEELARRHDRLRGAGSDAHTVGEVARSWVEVPRHPNEPGALLDALEDARIHGREASRAVHLASTWAKVRKKLPGAPGP